MSVRRQPNPGAGPSRQRMRAPITEADISALVAEFQAGTAAWKLAERYGIGLSTVKGILRDREVRLSDVLGRGSGAGSGPDRRMSRMMAEIMRAHEDGRLPDRFRAADIRRACRRSLASELTWVDLRKGKPSAYAAKLKKIMALQCNDQCRKNE
jgi:hypothetical protein